MSSAATNALRFGLFWSALCALASACTPETPSSSSDAGATSCVAGQTQSCACDGSVGTMQCSAGTWGACSCGPSLPGTDGGYTATAPASPLPCDVYTILSTHCAECHGVNNTYAAPMKLASWDNLTAQAPSGKGRVADVMLQRINDPTMPMPPASYGHALSDAEKASLQAWVAGGAQKGGVGNSCTPAVDMTPTTDADAGSVEPPEVIDPTGSPDDCEDYFEVRAHADNDPKGPYMAKAGEGVSGNTYHCFYFDPKYSEGSQALWFKSLADNKAILHHWLLYASESDTVHANGSQGPCSAAEPGAYLLAGWAPGAPDYTLPADVGIAMPTGPTVKLILEVHTYNTTGTAQADRSGVRFCTSKKGSRKNSAGISFTGGENICIHPNQTDPVVGMCDPDDNVGDIHLMRIWPHMHLAGRRMKVTILRASGLTEVLHDKPFDFNDQQAYDIPGDVVLKSGDRMQTECYYQNTTGQDIKFGENTQNEMCYGFVTSWPVGVLKTNAIDASFNPINAIGGFVQPARRCLDPLGITKSCGGVTDYPLPGGG